MDKIKEKLECLTDMERIKLTRGKNFWETEGLNNINSKVITDGPHGVRLQDNSTDYRYINLSKTIKSYAYPSISLLANSFDDNLVSKMSYHMGCEANSLGVSLLLGPGVNVIRHPRCGRAFEYISEDPIVSGRIGASFISGVEKSGCNSCVKHFILNNQEYQRMFNNSIIDSRTLHELYLKPFEICLSKKPGALMMSYNRVNNHYMCENKKAISYIRNVMKYKGLILSDWGGVSDPVESLKAGLNLQMPNIDPTRDQYVLDELNKGNLNIHDINKNAKYVIKFLENNKKLHDFDTNKAKNAILDSTLESIVLLKNESEILPLTKKEKVLVVGGFFEKMRFGGSGSSEVNPIELVNPKDSFDLNNVKYDYLEGFDTLGNISNLDKVLDIVKQYSKVLIFTGLPVSFESEGYDRDTMNLPKDYEIAIKKIASLNNNVSVVINAGSVCDVSSFINDIKGLVYLGLPGSFGGEAIYQILYGKVSPSGKLAQTYIENKDTYLQNKYPCKEINNKYSEGLYVGYPYYYIKNIKPIFSFGHGLSYSKFQYNVFDLDKTIDVSITSSLKARDVVYLFVEDNEHYIRLKDYKSVSLKKGETKTVSFNIVDDFFKFYSEDEKKEVLGGGKFNVLVGTSLDNILFTKEVFIKSDVSYIHPLYDLKLNKGLARKGKNITPKSTLEDIKDSEYFKPLLERFNLKDKLENETNLMLKSQIENSITDNLLSFYTLFTELNFTYKELMEWLDKINS